MQVGRWWYSGGAPMLLAGLLLGAAAVACGLALARWGHSRPAWSTPLRAAGLALIAAVAASAPLWFSPVTSVSI